MANSATEMVDLIKRIIREEEEKRDQVIVGTILSRNASDDTYDIYIDSELLNGAVSAMKRIPNESKHVYAPGDHVYVLKVRGQVAQGFIIGSVGAQGVSLNARVSDLSNRIDNLSNSVSSAMLLVAPKVNVEPFEYIYSGSASEGLFGLRVTWTGASYPTQSLYIHTNLRVEGTVYPSGLITVMTYPSVISEVPTDTNRFRVTSASNVFSGSSYTTVRVVGGDISPSNEVQRLDIAFGTSANPIGYSDVALQGESPLVPVTPRGFAIMESGFRFIL